jgi:hypothetical protein
LDRSGHELIDHPRRDRARTLLRRRAPVEHSMLLEDEAVNAKDSEARLDEFVREANPSRLRDEP